MKTILKIITIIFLLSPFTTFNNHPAIAQLLIDAGADIEAKNKYGSTRLHKTASQGDVDAMRKLLEAGADPNARKNDGSTVFMVAVRHAFLPNWEEGKEFNYETKTYEYPNYDERLAEGKQSLIDSPAMLKLLIEYGANPHAINNDGDNARVFIRRSDGYPNAPEVVKYLDELGVKTELELLRERIKKEKEAKAKEESKP